ncbi:MULTISPECIES: hypothetical protein [unclassified Mycobacterium]|uniref:hypothetical protein n=1 Tax=unclassified Mycobacterium TaxID=2642494 RepID=UPI000A6802B9|nr:MULTISPECIES: hypothetical protein [unclassified Mycobacterium]
MKPPHDDSIWPDDTRRAAVTLALAAAADSDMRFQDMIDSIEDALNSGRNLQFVLELVRLLTAEVGEQFASPESAAAYRQMAAEARAYEDDMRAHGEWRNDDHERS